MDIHIKCPVDKSILYRAVDPRDSFGRVVQITDDELVGSIESGDDLEVSTIEVNPGGMLRSLLITPPDTATEPEAPIIFQVTAVSADDEGCAEAFVVDRLIVDVVPATTATFGAQVVLTERPPGPPPE